MMNECKVEIHETSSRIVSVDAENNDDAIDKVREAYKSGKHVLDSSDFDDVGFEIV